MIDHETQLFKTESTSKGELILYYKAVNVNSSEFNSSEIGLERITEILRTANKKHWCSEAHSRVLKSGITLIFKYLGRDESLLSEFSITYSDCR
jgi:hypothetical protein